MARNKDLLWFAAFAASMLGIGVSLNECARAINNTPKAHAFAPGAWTCENAVGNQAAEDTEVPVMTVTAIINGEMIQLHPSKGEGLTLHGRFTMSPDGEQMLVIGSDGIDNITCRPEH